MTDYRVVTRHVRYWRGNIHRWSNSYQFTGSGSTPDATACDTIRNAESALCYSFGTASGGCYEVAFYLASGGTPVKVKTYFAYDTPASWLSYSSTDWSHATAAAAKVEPAAEVALGISWPAGVSSSGKPVHFRKWYHAVPVSQAASANGVQDIIAGDVTSLQAGALSLQTCLAPTYGLQMGNARRLAGTSPVVSVYYENHQMPKGRRRVSAKVATQAYKIQLKNLLHSNEDAPGDVPVE